MGESFQGFPRGGVRLLHELGVRQDRDWYNAHKPDFEEQLFAPLRALLDEAKPRLARLYPKRELVAKVFRLHRDVRFSKDKSPYKEHASGVLLVGPVSAVTATPGALYLQIGPEEGGASGVWSMEPEQLARFRKAVVAEKSGGRLQKLLEPLLADGYQIVSAGQLSRAPRGVDPLHPRSAVLRHKGLALDFPAIPVKLRHSEALLDWCVERAREVAPVNRWLLEHVG